MRFDRAAYESSGRLVVTAGRSRSARRRSPAASQVGDVIVRSTAADGGTNLDEVLANTIDRRVVSASTTGGAAPRDVVVRPTTQTAEKALMYRQWVEPNREYVLKISGGRLGYVHMIDMSAGALDQLNVDLDADNHARDGVIIDIRNNNGGFVNAYALDVFARRPYLRMSTRAVPEAPARSVLGQRALELPTALVTNQHSLSDAEDFTEGYRALKLGPGHRRADRRLDHLHVEHAADGRNDVPSAADADRRRPTTRTWKGTRGRSTSRSTRPIGESLAGTDAQLDAAVRTLLKMLGKAE